MKNIIVDGGARDPSDEIAHFRDVAIDKDQEFDPDELDGFQRGESG